MELPGGLLSIRDTHPTLLLSRAQEESTGLLSGLRIWHTQLLPGGLQGLILNPVFRQNLRIALLGGYVISFPPWARPGELVIALIGERLLRGLPRTSPPHPHPFGSSFKNTLDQVWM